MSDLSRVEQLLRNALGEDIYEVTPQSRVEALLVELNELIEGIGGSVSPEDIVTAVAAYLDEHLTNPTNPPIDTSLTIANAAADSKATGDKLSELKEELSDINSGNSALLLVKNEYVNTNGDIVSYNGWSRTDFIPVYAGGKIKIYSGYTSNYGAFYDSEKNYISPAQMRTPYAVYDVPLNAAYVCVSNATAKMDGVQIQSYLDSKVERATEYVIYPKGTEDLTSDIISALSAYGSVKLASGSFYTTGITMPVGSKLYGTGASTKVYLLQSVADGACITVGGGNIIDSIAFYQQGGYSSKPQTSAIGTVDGIRAANDVELCRISNCDFYGFARAGVYGHTVGHSSYRSLVIDKCRFMFCRIGVYFDYWLEYAVVANSHITQCYNGIRNDGGNNLFVGCHMDGNNSAFVMIIPTTDSPNDQHGSCVGCTFNHSDVYAIYVQRGSHGFIFSGCQIYYGQIYLRSCTAIVFDSCQIGGGGTTNNPDIVFYSGKGHRFNNISFAYEPYITDAHTTLATNVRFINSYLMDGTREITYTPA